MLSAAPHLGSRGARLTRRTSGVGWVASLAVCVASACSGPPCRAQDDCPLGHYCVLEVGGAGQLPEGECRFDCQSHGDCPQPGSALSRAVCSNEGRCRTIPRPSKLRILEPETDTTFPEGTRAIRVSGELETAEARATVVVEALAENNCSGTTSRALTVVNPSPGTVATIPFVTDDLFVDPGRLSISVAAVVGASRKRSNVDVVVECPGCAELAIDAPRRGAAVPGLELPVLQGSISPLSVRTATWRVFGGGFVMDGRLPVTAGRFYAERLPLFPGSNRIEVVVTGVGEGLGESRCSQLVTSGVASESGLRAVLSWSSETADLDLHLVGPGGLFGDPGSSLSSRGRAPFFGGRLHDDPLGLGPEVGIVEAPPDGVYGVVVEPVLDGADFGSDAILRVLFAGRPVVPGPIGPVHLTSFDGRLWIAGTVEIEGGAATWRAIDVLVSPSSPPSIPPERWSELE